MKKFINFVICGVLAIVVVIGLTTGRANAQELLEPSHVSCNLGNPVSVALGSENDTPPPGNGCEAIACEPGRQYYPNPSACDSFCQCSNGVPIYQPCPAGLEFNPNLNVCDRPEDVDCQTSN